MLNGSTGSRLKLRVTGTTLAVGTHANMQLRPYLDYGITIISVLGVDDDFQVHSFFLHDALQGYSVAVREGIIVIWNKEENEPLRLTQRLFVLKILNLRTRWMDLETESTRCFNCSDVLDLNSSVCSDGTWAISSRRT